MREVDRNEDRLFYVLTAPIGCPTDEFSEQLRASVCPKVADQFAQPARIRVRVADGELQPALIETPFHPMVPDGGSLLPVDAVIDITLPVHGLEIDRANELLAASASTCQGWRVEATPYSDSLEDPAIGVRSEHLGGGGFIRRLDGMTRERFSTEWHIHGVHTIARLAEQNRTLSRYIQNRVIEPITPTRWLLDGYEQAVLDGEHLELLLSDDAPKEVDFERDVSAGPGEVPFFRLPPTVFFAWEYLITA